MSILGALRLTVAHGVTTVAAGAFGFLAVFGLHEVIAAIVGQARFHRISAVMQAALVVVLMTALLLLPGANSNVARDWLAQEAVKSKALPPLWFVGLNETMAGSVIDALPRTNPARLPFGDLRYSLSLAVADHNATNRYRSLRPLFHGLAFTAIAALVLVAVVTTAACLWNSRRLPMPLVRRAHEKRAARRVLNWVATHAIATTPLRQAGFFFTLQTLSRQVSHRVTLASSWSVGLSLILIAARGHIPAGVSDARSVPLTILAAQSLLLASVLSGFRHAVRIPAERGASTTFGLAWAGHAAPYISGVKRAGWIALVLPTLGGLFVWHGIVLGTYLASLHLGIGLVTSTLLTETLFARCPLLPFASSYVPSGELRWRGGASAAALLLVSFALAWIERIALTTTAGYLMLVAAMVGLSAGIMAVDCALRRSATLIDLDEPTPFATQRLDLAG